jgi:hypothetical protein
MSRDLTSTLDLLLSGVVSSSPGVPGVVAMVTDRTGAIYGGAAGKRVLGEAADMTTDSVFAIFSTTKAITGTAVLQLVEEGKLDLDAPAKTLRARYRSAPSSRRFRRSRQADSSLTEARHHDAHAPLACRGLRV